MFYSVNTSSSPSVEFSRRQSANKMRVKIANDVLQIWKAKKKPFENFSRSSPDTYIKEEQSLKVGRKP